MFPSISRMFRVPQPLRADAQASAARPHVFGIGLPKTETTTLGAALARLGYRVRDFDREALFAVAGGDVEAALWRAEAYHAFEDSPWWMVYRELDLRFPGSLFILTERRDEEAWRQSGVKHLARATGGILDPVAATFVGHFARLGVAPDRQHEAYAFHGRAVRAHFAGRESQFRVLNWDRGDGWPELCGFLGVPAPSGLPFPHENAAPLQ
ncbi:MAG: sulfotransferase [Planctomycetota bacterium]